MSRLDKRPQINIDEVSQVSQEDRHPVEAFMTPKNNPKEKKRPKQHLFYFDDELKDALALMARAEKKDLSKLVKELLEKSIPEKYKQMARELKGD